MPQTSQAPPISPPTSPIFPSLGPFQLPIFVRWECAVLLVIGIAIWGNFFLHQPDTVHYAYKTDFLGIYVGARALATGLGPQVYELPVQRAISAAAIRPYERGMMPFVYPAYVAMVLEPLGTLSLGTAIKVWWLVNLAAVLWSGIRLSRLFAHSLFDRLAILLVFLAWPPTQLTLVQGQMGMWPTIGFVEGLIAVRSNRTWLAGLWLSLGLLKPQMVLFPLLLFLIWRWWKALAAFVAVGIGVVGISFTVIGLWVAKYLKFLADYNRRGAELALYPIAMQNWRGFASWIFRTDYGPRVVTFVVVFTALSVAALWLIARRSPVGASDGYQGSAGREAPYAVAIILGLLSSPHLYMHDWVAALPAGFVLWCLARARFVKSPRDPRAKVLLWLIGLAPLVFFTEQFIAKGPMVVIYGLILAGVAIAAVSFPNHETQRSGA